jgi:drug/metabolite transporter (DMT)-like permease
MSPLVPATGQMLAGALVIAPIALAIFGTALAYILLYWILDRLGATRTSMVTYLLPPFALLYGALLLGEPVTAGAVIGLGLVIAGILLANGVVGWFPSRPRAVSDVKLKS